MIRRLALLACAPALLLAQPNLMPWPAKISMGQGSLPIGPPFRVAFTGYSEPRLRAAAERVLGTLAPEFVTEPAQATLVIRCERSGKPVQELGEDESYRLEVTSQQATLSAPTPLGALHGLQTFLQLIESGPQRNRVPAASIEDQPRFRWRGLHLDVARHWMPVEVVQRNLDAMAAVKLNVFHWHLSDDQGFRVESLRFPKLQRRGSDGQYYTQQQVRDVIAYARDRGIRVVPEFDIPGHTTAWFVGYPQLASAAGPYKIERQFGVFDPTMDPAREATYDFLSGFLGEMTALFPDAIFHIGGDEVNGRQWKNNPRIRAFERAHHLKDAQALQAEFNRRVQKILAQYGKRMEGWDEILDADLSKGVVIQSWRGQSSLAEAARLGFEGLLSHGYYLDHMESAATLYAVDPLEGDAAQLTEEQKSRILGGEVAMWGEFVSAESVDSRIWPRAAAVAERLWSPQKVRDVPDMYRRLGEVSRSLDRLGLTHRSSFAVMLQRLTAGDPVEPLQTLADVVQPASFGQRIRTHKYTQQTPLDRLVDAARPESAAARAFAELVDRMDRNSMRAWLTQWRDNHARLKPTLEKSPLLVEDIPVSEDLSRLGALGLEALDDLDRGERPAPAWLAEQRSFLDRVRKPQRELLIAIVPSIQKLLDLAAAR